MRDKPYKVIVWGPGYTGAQALREIARRPELELVGCLGYSSDKAGKDAMEFVGEAPSGVKITTDKEEIYALDAEVVLYAARAMPDDSLNTEEVCKLLRSGKNVVASTAYFFPWQQGEEFVTPLEQACKEGGTTLHGTGMHPGWTVERWVMSGMGLCTTVQSIELSEVCDLSHHAGEAIAGIGYGMPPERLGSTTRKKILSRYYVECIAYLNHLLGLGIEEITADIAYTVSDKDFECAGIEVRKGTVGAVDGTWLGLAGGEPVVKIRELWYLHRDLIPDDVEIVSGDMYEVSVKGRPVDFSARADVMTSDRRDVFGVDDVQSAANLSTAVQLVQAIPSVVEAAPGILLPALFAYPAADLRTVVNPLAVRPKAIKETML